MNLLTKLLLKAYGPPAAPLQFGLNIYGITGALPASGNAIVTINPVAALPAVITPAFNASRTTGVAPLAVTFDSIGTVASTFTSLPYSEVEYMTNFADERGETWAYGTNPGGNNKNIAYGPVCAHVFEVPGTYVVTQTLRFKNSSDVWVTQTATQTITVQDPNVVFAGTATICISQNSLPVVGENGVPIGSAVQQVPNWSTVQTLAQTYKRILLKRGDTWTTTSGVTLGASHAGPGLIGAYGTGAKPVISATASMSHIAIESGAGDWRVVDILMTGASVAERTWSVGLRTSNATNALFLRTDVKWCWNLTNFANSNGVYVVGCDIGDVSDQGADHGYANWSEYVSRLTFLGSRLHGSDAHTARWQGVDMAICSNTTFDAPKGAPAYAWSMFTIRGKANSGDLTVWNGLWTESVVVSDIYVEAGVANQYAAFSIAPMHDGSAERIRNVLVERVRVSSLGSEAGVFAVVTGLTVRNSIFQTLHTSAVLIEAKSNTGGSPDMSQAFFYSNTLYKDNASLASGFAGISIPTRATGLVVRNNIAYAPGSTSPTMFGGAAVEGTNYTQSNNSSNAQVLSTRPWAAVTPSAAVDFTPSGSYAVGGGVWAPTYRNYMLTEQSAIRNMGAI